MENLLLEIGGRTYNLLPVLCEGTVMTKDAFHQRTKELCAQRGGNRDDLSFILDHRSEIPAEWIDRIILVFPATLHYTTLDWYEGCWLVDTILWRVSPNYVFVRHDRQEASRKNWNYYPAYRRECFTQKAYFVCQHTPDKEAAND